ncbi:hypothetical protein [Dactylosporangium matsuzakiense]|uniref:Uncharacterized protein n=1 Tax=Dactylosporangium matsuzakiense TaxID=53360 RepID=A0A9W6NNX7_9ACTN|nr:hypothetical protein [Dactylosporangium matsuzakiense]GLL03718.1 hypothetical protein GCM10017581_054640 [Dactylosporangium matsuzakiense]
MTAASTPAGDAFTTGELRAALQRIVFVRLSAEHGPGFGEGTIVAAQYWGAGKVVLTRVPDAATLTLVAHEIRGTWLAVTPAAVTASGGPDGHQPPAAG